MDLQAKLATIQERALLVTQTVLQLHAVTTTSTQLQEKDVTKAALQRQRVMQTVQL
jgi:hypothetical protein